MKRTHDRPNCNSFAVIRHLGIAALLTILVRPALWPQEPARQPPRRLV